MVGSGGWQRLSQRSRADEVSAQHGLASIDLHEGNYPAAKEKFIQVLKILQAIGDRAGEAATWHQLASIDMKEGNYHDAWVKCNKSLKIGQEMGNCASEAATWYQLGFIAWETGKERQALAMIAVSYGIFSGIGSGNVKHVAVNLAQMIADSDLSEDQVKHLLQSAWESYQNDCGVTLLREAFSPQEGS